MITRLRLSTMRQDLPKYRSMLAGNDAFIPTSFESIATVTATGGQTSLSFTSIPGTYKHLHIRGIAADTYAALSGSSQLDMRFNSDSGSNYARHALVGDGSTAQALAASNVTQARNMSYYYGSASSIFGASIVDIHDYADTTKFKTIRGFSGTNANVASTDFYLELTSSLWRSTSAITRIDILAGISGFKAGSTFALYGIKG